MLAECIRLRKHVMLRLSLSILLVMIGTLAGCTTGAKERAELTVAVANNADMVLMQSLSTEFEAGHPGSKLNWVMLDENTLRQRVTTDIATHGGQFDVAMIGTYEAPIWAKKGWLTPLDDLPPDYDVNDIIKPVREGLSYDGRLYALPFYGESSMTFYRQDLFASKGLTMPAQPTYADIERFARVLTNKPVGTYGICLRGQPGWGANVATIATMVNTFGGRWFDEGWHATIQTQPWKDAVGAYVRMLTQYGPPGANANNFNENLALFAGGHCAIWVDATVAAGILSDKRESQVADMVGFAPAPIAVTPIGSHTLWAWALGIAQTSKHRAEALQFVAWATSKEYVRRVGERKGWALAPPGTRYSTYNNAAYRAAAPFGALVLNSIATVDPAHPSVQPVPYTGIQYVDIPEFQGIGTAVGQIIAGVLAGRTSIDAGLATAQGLADRAVQQAGYQR
jgi:sorbitol/mannitol transport system substrate-binding protein